MAASSSATASASASTAEKRKEPPRAGEEGVLMLLPPLSPPLAGAPGWPGAVDDGGWEGEGRLPPPGRRFGAGSWQQPTHAHTASVSAGCRRGYAACPWEGSRGGCVRTSDSYLTRAPQSRLTRTTSETNSHRSSPGRRPRPTHTAPHLDNARDKLTPLLTWTTSETNSHRSSQLKGAGRYPGAVVASRVTQAAGSL